MKLEKIINKLEKNKEKIFFVAYITFMIGVMINSSRFSKIIAVKECFRLLQIFGAAIAIIKILLDFKEDFKNRNKLSFTIIIMLLLMGISYLVSRAKSIFCFTVFIMAAKDIDFKKIAKVTLIMQLVILTLIIIGSQVGIIENYRIDREGKIRQALGTASPNCLMLQVFQITALFLYVNKENIKLYDLAILVGMILLFYNITDSRMGMISAIFAIIAFGITKIRKFNVIFDKTKILFKYFSVILSLLIIIVTFTYREYNVEKLNILLSNRLELNVKVMDKYGIKLFGSYIKWVGQSDSFKRIDDEYNYIDSSYFRMIVYYGIIVSVFILYCMIRMTSDAYKKKDYFLISLIAIMQFYCFFDSWLLGIEFNTFLFLLSRVIYPFKSDEIKMLGEKSNGKRE